jgi:hypothetical protein
MFQESQISSELAQAYAAAKAANTYSTTNNGSSLDLQAGDKLFAMEGACPLKEADIEGKTKSWPTFTLKIERGGTTKFIDGVSVSNLERGSIFVLDKVDANKRYKIADLQPRLGRRGSVLTAANGVRYIPQECELGTVRADGKAYLATDFTKGKSDVKAVAPKNKNYGYIL